jgi:hypothetical protein
MQSEKDRISDGRNYNCFTCMNPTEDQQFQRLRRHNRKLVATVVGVLLAYFASLIAVCYFATHRAIHSIEQNLRNSAHWHP